MEELLWQQRQVVLPTQVQVMRVEVEVVELL
jgi:hypothetical protein